MLDGWEIEIDRLYGGPRGEWKRERLFEMPDGRHAIVLYDIDEVGVSKEAGRVAVLRDKGAPQIVFHPRSPLFWFVGDQTVTLDSTGRFATLSEFPGRRSRTIDLERGCFTKDRRRSSVDHGLLGATMLMGLAIPFLLIALRAVALENPQPGRAAEDATWVVLRAGLWLSLPVIALSLLFVLAIRKRSAEGVGWLALVIPIEIVFAPVLFAWLNTSLDQAPPEVHRVKVIDRLEETHNTYEFGTTRVHKLIVESWRDPAGRKTGDVVDPVYRRAAPGFTLTVRVRPGRFGYPWLERPTEEDLMACGEQVPSVRCLGPERH